MFNQVVGTAIAYLDLDATGFNTKLGTAWTQLQGIADSSLTLDQRFASMGSGLKTLGSTLTTSVTLPIAGGMALATKKTMDFEEAMSNVQALSGATGDEFDALREKALDLGGSTKFTSKEVADAFGYMALAGWKTEEMLAGISGVLDLAASSNMDLAKASDIVTDYLSAYGKEAAYSAQMADMMAYAQAHANTTTEQLGEAFGNSASFMNTAGQSMETTIALLSKMADQGLKGSEAGTALSAVMRDITQKMDNGKIAIGDVDVAVQDSEGNFRDLVDILADVQKATEGMGSAEKTSALMTTFTSRSIKGLGILLETGSEDIREFRNELLESGGTASEVSKVMLDNLAGSITYLKSAIDNFLIKVGDRIAPFIRKIADALTALTDKLNSLSDEQFDALVNAALVLAALGPVLTILGQLMISISNIIVAIKSISGVVNAVIGVIQGGTATLGTILGGIGAIIAGLILAVKNFVDMWKNGWSIIKTILELLGIALVAIGAIILGAPAAIAGVVAAIVFIVSQLVIVIHDHWDEIVEWTKNMIEKIKQGFTEFGEHVKEIFEKIKTFFTNLGNAISQWWSETLQKMKENFEKIKEALKGLGETISAWIKERIESIKQAVANVVEAIQNLWSKIVEIWGTISSTIQGWFEDIINAITTLFNNITEHLTTFFTSVIEHMKSAWERIISTINQIFENISNTVKRLFEGLTNLLNSLFDTVVSVINNLLTTISGMIDEFISVIEGIFKRISEILKQIVQTIKDMVEKVIQTIGDLVVKFVTTIQELWNKVTSMITETFQNLVKIIEENIQKVWDFLARLVEKFKDIGALILDKLLEGLKESWNRLSSWFEQNFGYLGTIIDKLKSKMSNLIPSSGGFLSGFSGSHANGLDYVPYDGYIAQLHKGERVLTKSENDSYGNQSSASGDTINIYTKDDPYYIGREIRKVKKELLFS